MAVRLPKWFEPKISIGNLISMTIVVVTAAMGYAVMTKTVEDTAKAIQDLPSIRERLTSLETRVNVSSLSRDKFEDETKVALSELRTELRERSIQILTQLATLSAQIESIDNAPLSSSRPLAFREDLTDQ